MERNTSIEKIRIFATILVVLGHSTFYTITTSIKSMGYDCSLKIIDTTEFHLIASDVIQFIYMFHMALFFSISGVVYEICLKKGKYPYMITLIRQKAKRLLLPYILVTVLYNIPIYYD